MPYKKRGSLNLAYFQPILTHPVVKSSAPHIFSLLAIIFFTVFVIRPTVFTITQLQNEIEAKNNLSRQLDQKIQSLQAAKTALDALSPESRDKINRAVPIQADVIDLVSNLHNSGSSGTSSAILVQDNTATVAGTAIQIQPVTLLTDAPIKYPFALSEVGFTYNLQGSYDQLLSIIDNLKTAARLLKLESIAVSNNTDQLKPGEIISTTDLPLTLSVTGKGYFLEHQQK